MAEVLGLSAVNKYSPTVYAEAKQQERLFDETVRVRVHHVAPELPGSGIVSAAAPAGSTAGCCLLETGFSLPTPAPYCMAHNMI